MMFVHDKEEGATGGANVRRERGGTVGPRVAVHDASGKAHQTGPNREASKTGTELPHWHRGQLTPNGKL